MPEPPGSSPRSNPPPDTDATLLPHARSADPQQTASLANQPPDETATLAGAGPAGSGREGTWQPPELPATFGRYRLEKLLGQGGMGAVYLAHDTQLDRPVALKVPHFAPEHGPQVLARFYREARAAATVLHPNVCPLYDVGDVGGTPYLTMAYVEGKPLAEFARARPLTPRPAALLVRKLALALQEAHQRGVIHRDLKPSNVMVDRRGEPVVMDFGLARRAAPGDPRLTQRGDLLGTPAYMAPEQVSDADATGPASDIYSLGVLLYELLTGRLPFTGDAWAVVAQVLTDEPPRPSQLRPGLDPELEAVCLKAMAKKPADRYASMAEMAAALLAYLRRTAPKAESGVAPVSPAKADTPPHGARTGQAGGARSATPPPAAPAERTSPAGQRGRPRRPSGPGRRLPPWLWVAGGAAALVLLLAGWAVYRATDYGTIRIDVGDAAGPVELSVDGEPGHRPGETFRLRAGEPHVVAVTGADLEPVTQPFTVHRGANLPRFVSLTKYGTVRIDLSDPRAPVKVSVDGTPRPVADLAQPLRLPAGKHTLEVTGDAFDPVHEDFAVQGGTNPDLAVPLAPKSGTVRIELSDPKAPVKVWVDDTPRPVADLAQPLQLPAGKHTLRVSGDDFGEVRREFVVQGGANPPLAVPLAAKYGTLRIELSEPKAAVKLRVDGSPAPVADPTQPLRLPAGKHTLEVSGDEYENVNIPCEVRGGEEQRLRVPLRRKPVAKAVAPPQDDWFILSDRNGYWTSDTNHPAAKKLKELAAAPRRVITSLAFTPQGDWVILYDGNQFATSNKELPACKKLHELWAQGGCRFKCVAFAPDGGWAVSYEKNNRDLLAADGIPQAARDKMNEFRASPSGLLAVAFPPTAGAWFIVGGAPGWAWEGWVREGDMRADFRAKVGELVDPKHPIQILCSAFTPAGEWFLLTATNECYASDHKHAAWSEVQQLRGDGRQVRWIAFAPKNPQGKPP